MLYQCYSLPTKTLINGETPGEDGREYVQLNPGDIGVCLKSKKAMKNATLKTYSAAISMTNFIARPHLSFPLIQTSKIDTITNKRQQMLDKLGMLPLSPLKARIKLKFGEACERCLDFYHDRYPESRQELRNKLATYINVPAY